MEVKIIMALIKNCIKVMKIERKNSVIEKLTVLKVIENIMAFLTSAIFSIFMLLFASFIISQIEAKLILPTDTQQLTSDMQKRPTIWLKSYPIRRSKQLPISSNIDDFIDETDDGIKKRFDNYGHMRFGKRSGPGGFDDYGDYG